MALTTGPQLRAARAITRMDQGLLAEKADVGVNTIRRLEAVDGELRATLATVRKLERALEAAGVEFLPGGGARLREQAEAS
jgi:predicted transcriptional regulator